MIYNNIKTLRKFSRWTPKWINRMVRRHVALTGNYRYLRPADVSSIPLEPEYHYPESPFTLGIIQEFFNHHEHYIVACRELRVSYKLINLSRPDWIQSVQNAGCDAHLVWPSTAMTVWKEMFDNRLKIMTESLGQIIYPDYDGIWLMENKYRVDDWLTAHQVPHPRTWVFYDLDAALKFLENADFPLVFKTGAGHSATGVRILREKATARRFIKKIFLRGFVPAGRHPNDRQWGTIYLQEYLADVDEWRMVRIGESFFGFRKGRKGDFHSGSHIEEWVTPSEGLLNFFKEMTDKIGFQSVNLDIFESPDGRYRVNELHIVSGQSSSARMKKQGVVGRYRYLGKPGEWTFEAGDFARNKCANLRVMDLLKQLGAID